MQQIQQKLQVKSAPTKKMATKSKVQKKKITQLKEIQNITRVQLVQEDTNLELGAIIVTICEGSSYDSLFTTVPQIGEEGTRIRVYRANTSYLLNNFKVNLAKNDEEIQKDCKFQEEREFYEDIKKVDPENIIFNWECSSSLGDKGFTVPSKDMFTLIKFLVDNKYYLMFSDFSLKALIGTWQSSIMGPNPFKKIGEQGSQVNLKFDPKQLIDSDSAQLNQVGKLCDQGFCNVHLMGGTIVYTVDFKKTDHEQYQLQVLTVAETQYKQLEESQTCKIGNNSGCAGHVVLTYPSGGKILTSMGHWVELMQLDTSEETLIQVAEMNYGLQYRSEMEQEMKQCKSQEERSKFVKKKAAQFVQQSAPCKSKKKSKY